MCQHELFRRVGAVDLERAKWGLKQLQQAEVVKG